MVFEATTITTFFLFYMVDLNLLLLLPLLLLLLLPIGSYASCSDGEISGLLAFTSHVHPTIWAAHATNPRSRQSCCEWEGITCDDDKWSRRRIVAISLSGRGLRGSLSHGLANISSLQVLNVSINSLSGSMPEDMASLSQLHTIDLSSNNFSGDLSFLAKSSQNSLQHINVSSNGFHGTLLPLRNLTSLTSLWARNNSLTGGLGPLLEICKHAPPYPPLQVVDLSSNNLSGAIQEGLGNCTNLQVLDLGENHLDGPIPHGIYKLQGLTKLCLAKNNFSGEIDEAIGNLMHLSFLMLSANNLTGPLPANLSSCSNLKVFTANSNEFHGSIDTIDFARFSLLENLDLNTNSFSGSIPSSLSQCKALKSLNLAKNKLSGVIPSSLNQLKQLTTLLLSSNKLNGSIQSLEGSKALVSVILSKNNMFGEMLPDTISGLENLQVLALGNLHLHGSIPNWLKNCTKLQVLDLSWNHLTGAVPRWIGQFPHLFYLDLSNNSLSGSIPPELFALPALMGPDENLKGLQSVVSNLAIKQKVDSPELQYTQISAFPPSIYLSHNHFEGLIPSQVGAFVVLLEMDLSFNNFSGNIPDSIANMTDLESLDLSYNSFNGSIPSSLTHLTFLAYFNVSHNQLVGAIPQGNQFSTFSSKSFEGNGGLCGPPLLSSPCHDDDGNVGKVNPSRWRPTATAIRIAILAPVFMVFGLMVVVVAVGFSWKMSGHRICMYGGSFGLFKDIDGYNGPQSLTQVLDTPVELFYRNGKLTVFDLFKATNNFDSANIVGCGGFGLVYRADLSDGSRLAIKKLTGGDCGQMEREFRAEVEALSKAQHKNLVPLQGYLQAGNEKMLLYSYMENGSLDYWLHERVDSLDWPTRLNIAQGAAHGLAYLHQVCNPHIVHRDIKSSNILLDERFQAHLADFGLARLMMSTETHVTTEVVGTLGYIPPEYCNAINATPRGDVYSFGVVLLELLTRRRPVDVLCKGGGDLVAWVIYCRSVGKCDEIFDSVLQSKGHDEEMLQVLDVACPCLNPDPAKRPTICDVVNWLDKIGQGNDLTKALP